jgi:hypothetical protein
MNELFQDELLEDERLLWVGQPDPRVLFTGVDIFLIPFSIMWGGFALFWEVSVLTTTARTGAPTGFFALWGIPFVILGLYFMIGRFVYKRARKRKTYYAVTNKRVLVLTRFLGDNLQAANIHTIPIINRFLRSDGTGTVRFGNISTMAAWYANTGMEFFGGFYGADVPTFYDIPDANSVYRLVTELRNKPAASQS